MKRLYIVETGELRERVRERCVVSSKLHENTQMV